MCIAVDEEGQVVKPWSSSIEIKAYLVNAVGDVVYERFDYADPLAGHTANVNPRGTATFPDLRVLMPSDLTRGGAYKLCFVATDWAVEPVVSREFSVIDETRPHGANFKCSVAFISSLDVFFRFFLDARYIVETRHVFATCVLTQRDCLVTHTRSHTKRIVVLFFRLFFL